MTSDSSEPVSANGHPTLATALSGFYGESDFEHDVILRLLKNNRSWAHGKVQNNPSYFTDLAKGQNPHYMMIACSDSRVPPDQLTQTQPGDIFIHRNVANLVVNVDMNVMSVLQYAVEVLKVKHVIVMGHYGCGGVKAALDHQSHGLIDKWLSNIRDVYRLHRHEVDAIPEGDQRLKRMVELNVIEQVVNLHKTSILQRAWSLGQNVSVHGWVYDINSGLVCDLDVHRDSVWTEIGDIYRYDYTDVHSMLATPALPMKDLVHQLGPDGHHAHAHAIDANSHAHGHGRGHTHEEHH